MLSIGLLGQITTRSAASMASMMPGAGLAFFEPLKITFLTVSLVPLLTKYV
jgi:hypothetical protein